MLGFVHEHNGVRRAAASGRRGRRALARSPGRSRRDTRCGRWANDETDDLLVAVTALRARVAELELRVAAHAERVDVGARRGATSAASWWAHRTRLTRAEAHRRMRLARGLDRHEPVADALAAGDLNDDQAAVIVDAIDALPEDLVDPEVAAAARARLVVEARSHDAKALRILGRRILEVVAPDVGEAHERRILEREERDARAACRFTLTDDGHGRAHGRFTLPTLQAEMLRKALTALAAPRRRAGDPRAAARYRNGSVRRSASTSSPTPPTDFPTPAASPPAWSSPCRWRR